MEHIQVNEHYQIHEKLFETQGLTIYRAVRTFEGQSTFVTLHAIKNRALIKYFIPLETVLKNHLPLIESFVLDGDFYLSFETLENGTVLTQRALSTAQKKKSLLHFMAKLAIGHEIPNFIKWQLINSDSLRLDRNKILHIDVKLCLLNPDFFNDFKSIQVKMADLISEIFDAPIEDKGILLYLERLRKNSYADEMEMFTDAKVCFSMTPADEEEPLPYAWLYQRYLALKKNSKRLVWLLLVLVIAYQVNQYFLKAQSLGTQPYIKTKIGTLVYDDPYSAPLESANTLVLEAPPKPTSEKKTSVPNHSETPTVSPTKNDKKAPDTDVIYSVKRNEYLVKISKDFYGDGKYAWAIAKYNQIKTPSFLRVNYPLKLPPKPVIEKLYQEMTHKK